MKNNPALVAALLRRASREKLGTAQLAKKMRLGPARLIALVNELKDQGLVEVEPVHSQSPGRPLATLRTTPLGVEFLAAYETLALKALRSHPSDLRRAVADAEYARRLASRGVNAYDLFLELNSLVIPIRETSS